VNPLAPVRLELQDVSKSFGGIRAVRGLTLHVRRGEILGLIGPNGAGKSTVLSLIAGQQRASAGRIFLDGRRLDQLPQWKRVRAGVAHVPQHAANLDRSTVGENVLVGLGALGARRSSGGWLRFMFGRAAGGGDDGAGAGEAGRSTLRVLDEVGLAARAHEPASALTHWERRLLSVARLLAANPAVILFDEPFAGLSAIETERLMAIIQRLRQERERTFVVAEHNVDAVLRLCDRIAALHFGEQIACDVPERIVRDERVIEVYLGGHSGGRAGGQAGGRS
jgi:branched-chain amino acid transport system ATP-binding protein